MFVDRNVYLYMPSAPCQHEAVSVVTLALQNAQYMSSACWDNHADTGLTRPAQHSISDTAVLQGLCQIRQSLVLLSDQTGLYHDDAESEEDQSSEGGSSSLHEEEGSQPSLNRQQEPRQ